MLGYVCMRCMRMRQSGINLRVVRIVVHLRPELSTIIGIIIIIPRGSSISSCLLILGTPTQHPSIPSASLDRRSDRPDSPPTSTLVSVSSQIERDVRGGLIGHCIPHDPRPSQFGDLAQFCGVMSLSLFLFYSFSIKVEFKFEKVELN